MIPGCTQKKVCSAHLESRPWSSVRRLWTRESAGTRIAVVHEAALRCHRLLEARTVAPIASLRGSSHRKFRNGAHFRQLRRPALQASLSQRRAARQRRHQRTLDPLLRRDARQQDGPVARPPPRPPALRHLRPHRKEAQAFFVNQSVPLCCVRASWAASMVTGHIVPNSQLQCKGWGVGARGPQQAAARLARCPPRREVHSVNNAGCDVAYPTSCSAPS